jgi:hypothetical protein
VFQRCLVVYLVFFTRPQEKNRNGRIKTNILSQFS